MKAADDKKTKAKAQLKVIVGADAAAQNGTAGADEVEPAPPLPPWLRSESSEAALEISDTALLNAIHAALKQLENQQGVRVDFAAEKSSRIFGTSHSQSDCDIIALFMYPSERYYSMRPMETSTRIQCPEQPGSGLSLFPPFAFPHLVIS